MFAITAAVVVYAIRRLASHPTRIAAVIISLATLVAALAAMFDTLQVSFTADAPAEPASQEPQEVP
ncbi:hypothetical protein [Streptomyces sedi]|uniref:hypothetical protein n=1 Tax=Streptomyces sedi TaxID=555059 RepID=UPI001476C9D5|nr:hypothetical protein [Streptomyces sedi]